MKFLDGSPPGEQIQIEENRRWSRRARFALSLANGYFYWEIIGIVAGQPNANEVPTPS
jgi:hypothetical protein